MKHLFPTALAISLMLNGLLTWHCLRQQPLAAPTPIVRTLIVEKEKHIPAVFEWKQLEAPDFPTYIANLRQAGCPEPTLRAIIQPELSQALHARQREAGRTVDEATLVPEEKQMLDSLLVVQSVKQPDASQLVAPQPVENPTPTPPVLPSVTAFAPAAFLIGNAPDDPVLTPEGLSILPSDTTLPAETLQRLGEMRRQFGEQASSSAAANQAELDPERQWRKARRDSDDIFISRYGGDYFMRVQQNARLQEVLNAQKKGAL